MKQRSPGEESPRKQNRKTVLLMAAAGCLIALGKASPVPAQSSFVASAARLFVPPTAVDTACGTLTLGGAVDLLTQVTYPTDPHQPCQALARVHGAGVLRGTHQNARLYHAVLAPSWTQQTVCLGGAPSQLPMLFRLYPIDPHQPVDACQDAVVMGTLTLAFTAEGRIDTGLSSISLGGGGDSDHPRL